MNVLCVPGMIGSNRLIAIVSSYFIHLHELMKLCFGILNRPITMNRRVYVERLSFFHCHLLVDTIQVTLWSEITLLATLMIWTIRCAQILWSKSTLRLKIQLNGDFGAFDYELTVKTGAAVFWLISDGILAGPAVAAMTPSVASPGTSFGRILPLRTRKLM